MAKKNKGLNAGTKLKKRRHSRQLLNRAFVQKLYNLKSKSDPLSESSQAKWIVLEKWHLEAKQPNSTMRKCTKIH